MNTHSNKIKTESRIEIGDVLLAQPFWMQEDYKRSVILILDHDKDGSTGIILNKISNLIVHDAIPKLNLYHPIYYGGSRKSELITYIHNFPGVPNVRALGHGLYWGGNEASLQGMIHTNLLNSGSIKFCAGFVEWAAGELENELNENKWWSANIDAQELFTMPYERLWSYKLIHTGHMYGIFDECADPFMN